MRNKLPIALISICLSPSGIAADVTSANKYDVDYSPYANADYAKQPLWGDTHLHTLISGDAIAYGTILTHSDAYKFARGEQITTSHGAQTKLSRPLDFLVVADHAEGYGVVVELKKGNKNLIGSNKTLQRWSELLNKGPRHAAQVAGEIVRAQATGNLPEGMADLDDARNMSWQASVKTATKYNEPGRFTALSGFEWSSLVQGNNLHRVVIFSDDADKTSQIIPLDSNESGQDPEKLWEWMQAYEEKTSGRALAIPHNPNLSNGIMFQTSRFNGEPMTTLYAKNRMRWEPLTEATQIKGDSEAHPLLSPNDEFANFETWDKGNLGGIKATTEAMLPGSYVRTALKDGLVLEGQLNANPFKFGLIGSTDSHTGLANAEENNFYGKHAQNEPQPNRWKLPKKKPNQITRTKQGGWEYSASGLAAVWAKDNTRDSIFNAMQRKETYATTGPRITLRMFGGWSFSKQDANNPDIAEVGYAKGVPMGSDLTSDSTKQAPGFLITSNMDPLGASLDRIQIVKGWVDAQGHPQEKIFNVAWAGNRKINSEGKLPAVGNTVDIANATWTNDIGSSELTTFWQDPEFNSDQRAFYYARVLEIPTPRWTAYDQNRFGITMDDDVPMVIQERAYGSPIWYTP